MRRIFLALFVLVVLALNWAALHDILKGETDVWLEWSFVISSLLLLFVYMIRKVHHSV